MAQKGINLWRKCPVEWRKWGFTSSCYWLCGNRIYNVYTSTKVVRHLTYFIGTIWLDHISWSLICPPYSGSDYEFVGPWIQIWYLKHIRRHSHKTFWEISLNIFHFKASGLIVINLLSTTSLFTKIRKINNYRKCKTKIIKSFPKK